MTARKHPGRVGPLDALLRATLALLLLVATFSAVRSLEANAYLVLLTFPLLGVGYLLLTAGVRLDPVYAMLGLDSGRRHARAAERKADEPARA